MSPANLDRRDFLQKVGTVAAAGCAATSALPLIVSQRAFAAPQAASPNDRIRLGFIGVRNQGGQLLEAFSGSSDIADIVALCDVDSSVLNKALQSVEKLTGRTAASYHDYRKLLDNPNIDAVVVATPDHWHARQTIDACTAGKDVYCEKPLSLTIAEGQAMVAAARQHVRVVQTGSKWRSDPNVRLGCELVRAGLIGKVHTVRAGLFKVNFDGPAVPDCDSHAELDYEFWLGPAPQHAYNPKRVHYNFRFFWDYSGGQLTNFGAHFLDVAHWGLNRDNSGPVSIEGEARYNEDHWYEVPEWCRVVYKYDDGVTVICGHDEPEGTTFEGEKGTIRVDRGKLEIKPADLFDQPIAKPGSLRDLLKNHAHSWLTCIPTREKPICDVAIGHRSATVCNLGNIAIRSGRKVTWDPVHETIVGDAEQTAMLSRPYRAPWVAPTV